MVQSRFGTQQVGKLSLQATGSQTDLEWLVARRPGRIPGQYELSPNPSFLAKFLPESTLNLAQKSLRSGVSAPMNQLSVPECRGGVAASDVRGEVKEAYRI